MHSDETASKVNAVLLRAEEQARMIESLHNSVSFVKCGCRFLQMVY